MKTQSYFLFIILVFTLFITKAALAETHFTPPEGNPFSPMNIFIVGVSCKDYEITDGDEIAVFDGGLCAGAKVFAGEVSITNPLEVIASKDDCLDANPNGFTESNEIIFRLWNTSAQKETILTPEEIQFYDPASGNPIDPVPYEGKGTAAAAITVASSVSLPSSEQEGIPQSYSLDQNYPNPFNPSTSISYALAQPSQVELKIFNLKGGLVKTLFDGRQSAGNHSIQWNGANNLGEEVATGIYFYKLTTDKFVAVKKMILSK